MHHLHVFDPTQPQLLTLLLQTTPHPFLLYLSSALGVLGFGFAVWSFWRKESREDKLAHEAAQAAKFKKLEDAIGQFVDRDALEKRFGGIDTRVSTQGTELANQHNTLMEYLRERERLSGLISGRLNLLEEKVHVFEVVPSRVDKLESKLDNLHSLYSELKTGQRELRNEMREDMKSNKGEILDAIKSLKP